MSQYNNSQPNQAPNMANNNQKYHRGGGNSGSSDIHSNRVFVGGFQASIVENDLYYYFSKFGVINNVEIIYDNKTGISKCFGFVECANPQIAQDILSKKHQLNGRAMDVNCAFKKNKTLTQNWRKILHKKKLFVTNLTYNTTSKDLEMYFRMYGKVRKAYIITDPKTQASKGFGYVEFFTPEGADEALRRKDHMLNGVHISCFRFKHKFEMENDMPGGGPHGGGGNNNNYNNNQNFGPGPQRGPQQPQGRGGYKQNNYWNQGDRNRNRFESGDNYNRMNNINDNNMNVGGYRGDQDQGYPQRDQQFQHHNQHQNQGGYNNNRGGGGGKRNNGNGGRSNNPYGRGNHHKGGRQEPRRRRNQGQGRDGGDYYQNDGFYDTQQGDFGGYRNDNMNDQGGYQRNQGRYQNPQHQQYNQDGRNDGDSLPPGGYQRNEPQNYNQNPYDQPMMDNNLEDQQRSPQYQEGPQDQRRVAGEHGPRNPRKGAHEPQHKKGRDQYNNSGQQSQRTNRNTNIKNKNKKKKRKKKKKKERRENRADSQEEVWTKRDQPASKTDDRTQQSRIMSSDSSFYAIKAKNRSSELQTTPEISPIMPLTKIQGPKPVEANLDMVEKYNEAEEPAEHKNPTENTYLNSGSPGTLQNETDSSEQRLPSINTNQAQTSENRDSTENPPLENDLAKFLKDLIKKGGDQDLQGVIDSGKFNQISKLLMQKFMEEKSMEQQINQVEFWQRAQELSASGTTENSSQGHNSQQESPIIPNSLNPYPVDHGQQRGLNRKFNHKKGGVNYQNFNRNVNPDLQSKMNEAAQMMQFGMGYPQSGPQGYPGQGPYQVPMGAQAGVMPGMIPQHQQREAPSQQKTAQFEQINQLLEANEKFGKAGQANQGYSPISVPPGLHPIQVAANNNNWNQQQLVQKITRAANLNPYEAKRTLADGGVEDHSENFNTGQQPQHQIYGPSNGLQGPQGLVSDSPIEQNQKAGGNFGFPDGMNYYQGGNLPPNNQEGQDQNQIAGQQQQTLNIPLYSPESGFQASESSPGYWLNSRDSRSPTKGYQPCLINLDADKQPMAGVIPERSEQESDIYSQFMSSKFYKEDTESEISMQPKNLNYYRQDSFPQDPQPSLGSRAKGPRFEEIVPLKKKNLTGGSQQTIIARRLIHQSSYGAQQVPNRGEATKFVPFESLFTGGILDSQYSIGARNLIGNTTMSKKTIDTRHEDLASNLKGNTLTTTAEEAEHTNTNESTSINPAEAEEATSVVKDTAKKNLISKLGKMSLKNFQYENFQGKSSESSKSNSIGGEEEQRLSNPALDPEDHPKDGKESFALKNICIQSEKVIWKNKVTGASPSML